MTDPREDPTSIGNVLKPFGVTRNDIVRALEYMAASEVKLGVALVELGVITKVELDAGLSFQKIARNNNGRKGAAAEVAKVLEFATDRTRRAIESNLTVSRISAQFLNGKG